MNLILEFGQSVWLLTSIIVPCCALLMWYKSGHPTNKLSVFYWAECVLFFTAACLIASFWQPDGAWLLTAFIICLGLAGALFAHLAMEQTVVEANEEEALEKKMEAKRKQLDLWHRVSDGLPKKSGPVWIRSAATGVEIPAFYFGDYNMKYFSSGLINLEASEVSEWKEREEEYEEQDCFVSESKVAMNKQKAEQARIQAAAAEKAMAQKTTPKAEAVKAGCKKMKSEHISFIENIEEEKAAKLAAEKQENAAKEATETIENAKPVDVEELKKIDDSLRQVCTPAAAGLASTLASTLDAKLEVPSLKEKPEDVAVVEDVVSPIPSVESDTVSTEEEHSSTSSLEDTQVESADVLDKEFEKGEEAEQPSEETDSPSSLEVSEQELVPEASSIEPEEIVKLSSSLEAKDQETVEEFAAEKELGADFLSSIIDLPIPATPIKEDDAKESSSSLKEEVNSSIEERTEDSLSSSLKASSPIEGSLFGEEEMEGKGEDENPYFLTAEEPTRFPARKKKKKKKSHHIYKPAYNANAQHGKVKTLGDKRPELRIYVPKKGEGVEQLENKDVVSSSGARTTEDSNT